MKNKTPVEVLKQNGFVEITPEEIFDLETKDYFYLNDEMGTIHYFKRK